MQQASVKLLLVALLLGLSVAVVSAQTNKKPLKAKGGAPPAAPALFIKADGNVGIGVENPINKLQLGGDLHMNGNTIYFRENASDKFNYIRWNNPDTTWVKRDDKMDVAGFKGVRLGDVYDKRSFFPVLSVGRWRNFKGKDERTPAVEIQAEARTEGNRPGQLALYVSGNFESRGQGVEFKNTTGTSGIGFTKNTIYTAGTNNGQVIDQELNLEVLRNADMRFKTNGIERLRIDGSGNIWTNGGAVYLRGGFDDKNQYVKWKPYLNNTEIPTNDRLQIGGWNGVEIGSSRDNVNNIMVVDQKGFVGIGESEPQFPLHVTRQRGGESNLIRGGEYGYTSSGPTNQRYYTNVSILAGGHIATHNALISASNTNYSDIRLKKNITATSSRDDLEKLRSIAVMNYKMIDTVSDNNQYKKVIAQQVQKVYPDAINTTFNTLPDVYQHALSVTSRVDSLYIITLAKAAPIKAGDVLEFKCSKTNDARGTVINVSDGGKTFTIHSATILTGQKDIFVYGHPATDVLTVDYDAISMLNVSATQQLAKTIDEQEKRIAALEKQVEQLSQMVTALIPKTKDSKTEIAAQVTASVPK